MRMVTRVLIAAALAFGSGCAQTDWINRTLVTVDVTGTWSGTVAGGGASPYVTPDLLLELEQQGSRVKGSLRLTPGGSAELGGTVAGDVFRFRALGASANNRDIEGEVTVSGDEMSGRMSTPVLAGRPLSLRRVDPSSRPGPPTR